MGRSPCCDNPGIKKGPWSPEEDIVLFSYIQQHGPGNWRSVPINTGLLRCSKSCRLRWTNYLRPGIKRGRFTPLEEGIIVRLQALIGNRWATIASYLPERTDNDIKNYWNTHLKKKLKKIHDSFRHNNGGAAINYGDLSLPNGHASFFHSPVITIENRTSNQNLTVFDSSSSYASSADNISRLLQGWIHSSSKPETNNSCSFSYNSNDHGNFINYVGLESLDLPEKLTWPENPPAVDGRSSSLKFLENCLLEDTAGVQFDGLVEELPTELVQIY